MNYKNLLQPDNVPVKTTILGHPVFLCRMTAKQLDDYEKAVAAVPDGKDQASEKSRLGIQLILDALRNEDGSTPKPSELPKVDDLLASRSPGDLLEAMVAVQTVSWSTRAEAEKN
ncbi:phage tail protein [Pectobacterium aroidearum]|uniref:Phage tail protein n=1 Tax=Pectobacterium aroidearum TaxID=1201031 RepID=A0ABR5ZJJ8_9GAMM|nr:phage tail protein [Pectobacterium aroidearum]MBA5234753.1 phage tail protein [Pectobacterium aroidearum]MBA5739932.1 phage tail protein [Pectobacterium aroidearum]